MRTCYRGLLGLPLLACAIAFLALPPPAAAQRLAGCDAQAMVEAKGSFKGLRLEFIRDKESVDEWEFRAAAAEYVQLAEQCYHAKYGGAPISGQMIDEGGMLMGASGAYVDQDSTQKYVLWGGKWGAGTPFAGPGSFTDFDGPEITGGTVTYSFMADAVVLDDELIPSSPLPNTAVTSLGTFAPCFLDELEQAFGAWSAVADILFVPVTDGGGAFNAEPTGDIRIGAHTFDGAGSVLAHAFFPPPNGTFAAGDLHFDTAEAWTCAPAAGTIGIGLVALHEIGHAIGLRHEVTDLAVMNAFYNGALTFGPLADDIIGVGQIYGGAGATETTFFGRVGIGTDAPAAPLDINIGTTTPGTGNSVLRLERVGPVGFQLKDTNDAAFWQFSAATGASEFRISRSGTGVTEMRLTNTGNLIIQGDITSNGTTFVPDYVFGDTYKLMPLSELAAFIEAEQHLPNVPAAEEIQQAGLNMTDMQMRLLEKIEELTLYTLDQQRTIEELRTRLEAVER